MPRNILTRSIWIISFVSLLTDVASEMLYPFMPIYLKNIGFGLAIIGLLEGTAEAVAGLSKGYFGKLSDVSGKRLPFVQWGYFLSAISKPMLSFFVFPAWIFFARTLDRLGKGMRTGARDAMLSDETTPETKGRVFGFHRSMDTIGAVLGPSIALIYLYFFPEQYINLFLIAFIPGMAAVVCTLFLSESKNSVAHSYAERPAFFSFLRYWKDSPSHYRKLVIGLLIFSLFNSSDVFLLLKMKDIGCSDVEVIGIYIFYNLVYAFSAYPLGIWADKVGIKTVFVLGLLVFACVYVSMALNTNHYVYYVLFAGYGLYAAMTEGIGKAWISNISAKEDTATAIGFYTGISSLTALFASTLAGVIWFVGNGVLTFCLSAGVALGVAVYLYHKIPFPNKDKGNA